MAHDLSDFEWTCMHITRCGFLKCYSDYITRKYLRRNRTQAIAEYLGSASDPKKPTGKSSYHPSEDIRAYVPEKNPGDSRLSPPETARTIIESCSGEQKRNPDALRFTWYWSS